jgi:hypothetical protein
MNGKTLRHYQAVRTLDEGGMAEVHQAKNQKLGGTRRSRSCLMSSPGTLTALHASGAKPNCPIPRITPIMPPAMGWRKPAEQARTLYRKELNAA